MTSWTPAASDSSAIRRVPPLACGRPERIRVWASSGSRTLSPGPSCAHATSPRPRPSISRSSTVVIWKKDDGCSCWCGGLVLGKQGAHHVLNRDSAKEAVMRVEQQVLEQRGGLLTTHLPDGSDGDNSLRQ